MVLVLEYPACVRVVDQPDHWLMAHVHRLHGVARLQELVLDGEMAIEVVAEVVRKQLHHILLFFHVHAPPVEVLAFDDLLELAQLLRRVFLTADVLDDIEHHVADFVREWDVSRRHGGITRWSRSSRRTDP